MEKMEKTELFGGYKMTYYILCFNIDKTTISSIISPARLKTRTKEKPYYEDYQEKWCGSPI